MNRLLHVTASPRGPLSRTLTLASIFLERFRARHPEAVVDELDLFREKLPELVAETVRGKYFLMGGKEIPPELKGQWDAIVGHINRFQSADAVLISSPMWNFGPPYVLKHYLDVILQPRYLFRYGPNGVEGLAKARRAFVITTRGGDYTAGGPAAAFDQLDPYLRQILGFIGIPEVTFLDAQPMDAGGEATMKQRFDETADKIRALDL